MLYRTSNYANKTETPPPDTALSSRTMTARNIAQDYAMGTLNSDAQRSAENLIKVFINDSNSKVRGAISNQLNTCPHLQRDIAFQLAMDCENVALPILQASAILDEADLLEILSSATEIKQIAIAGRGNISSRVTTHIAQHGTRDAVKACLSNHKASFSEEDFEHIMLQHLLDKEILKLIIGRTDLPEDTLVRLYQNIPEEQRKQLVQENGAPHIVASQVRQNEKEQALALLLFERESMDEKQKAATQLNGDGRLTFTLLLRSLILSDRLFFAAGLALKSGTSKRRILSLFAEQNERRLKNLLKNAAVPPHLSAAFKITIEEIWYVTSGEDKSPDLTIQRNILDRISKMYNYETSLSVEKIMEKFIQKR